MHLVRKPMSVGLVQDPDSAVTVIALAAQALFVVVATTTFRSGDYTSPLEGRSP
jgi:hypothetical protein